MKVGGMGRYVGKPVLVWYENEFKGWLRDEGFIYVRFYPKDTCVEMFDWLVDNLNLRWGIMFAFEMYIWDVNQWAGHKRKVKSRWDIVDFKGQPEILVGFWKKDDAMAFKLRWL